MQYNQEGHPAPLIPDWIDGSRSHIPGPEYCVQHATVRFFAWMGLVWGFPCQAAFLGVSFELVAAIATGRIDGRQGVEVEFCDDLQRLACWRRAKAVGKRVEPCNVFGL